MNPRGSQFQQDLWVLSELTEKVGGFFVELGALDGLTNSNTLMLEEVYQWKGICIEAHSSSFAKLRRNRNCVCVNACVDGVSGVVDFHERTLWPGGSGIVGQDTDNKEGKPGENIRRVETKTLEAILDEHSAPPVIDNLSLDVEGAETRILRDFDFRKYRFRCMTIERCSKELVWILEGFGYRVVKIITDPLSNRPIDFCFSHANERTKVAPAG